MERQRQQEHARAAVEERLRPVHGRSLQDGAGPRWHGLLRLYAWEVAAWVDYFSGSADFIMKLATSSETSPARSPAYCKVGPLRLLVSSGATLCYYSTLCDCGNEWVLVDSGDFKSC